MKHVEIDEVPVVEDVVKNYPTTPNKEGFYFENETEEEKVLPPKSMRMAMW